MATPTALPPKFEAPRQVERYAPQEADLPIQVGARVRHARLAGDAVLKGIAEVFRAELRHYDVPARFGGEEFSILLPETSPETALEIAERIRRAVAESAFEVETFGFPVLVSAIDEPHARDVHKVATRSSGRCPDGSTTTRPARASGPGAGSATSS